MNDTVKAADAKEKLMKVEILRGYWPSIETQQLRVAAGLPENFTPGETAKLPYAEANRVIRAGIATLPNMGD